MLEKLKAVEARYEEVGAALSDPAVVSDQDRFRALMKEHKELSPVVETYRAYRAAEHDAAEAKSLLDDGSLEADFRALAEEEWQEARTKAESLADELRVLLLPREPNDDKNVVVEIRGGAGGEEAALFAADLMRMYTMYAEAKGYKVELAEQNETELGGYKEVSFMIEGEGAYSRFKYESGVHRVQRVPETESQGRIQTSTVTVAVLPEAEEVELEINPADLQIDTYRSGGAGGQHVNKTESAIRITHLPTGLVVECQDERSQYKNKDKAMKVLRSRLYEKMMREHNEAIAGERRAQVGTGDRSERIRTYNYPQGRVSDHRIGLTLYKLEAILNGDLDELIDAVVTHYRAEMLKAEQTDGKDTHADLSFGTNPR